MSLIKQRGIQINAKIERSKTAINTINKNISALLGTKTKENVDKVTADFEKLTQDAAEQEEYQKSLLKYVVANQSRLDFMRPTIKVQEPNGV